MNNGNLLTVIGMIIIPFLIVYLSIFIGHRYGSYNKKKSPDLQEGPVGTVVASAFALLAFMLAFTFQIATNKYDTRKQLLLDEVTNIRTTYLRAGLIPEPICSETKELLVEYVDIRIEVSSDYSKLDSLMLLSQQILDRLWDYTETLAEQDRSSEVYALFTSSINDLVDNYNQRITYTFEYRIPVVVLWILSIITILSMLMLGYLFGISGKGSFKLNLLLAIIFALVMFLIFALDRPETGLAKMNQRPMITLQHQLQVMQSAGNN
jgi:hypothetical protein